LVVCGLAFGCGSKATTPPPADPKPADPQDSAISLVTSVVVIDACPDSKKLDSKSANREIQELVGPCKKVPGGAAHFSAILLPGGQVELASPSGDVNEGIVPTCVMQQQKQLRHKLRLTKACKFDVKLEQRLSTARD
jgi:hypothetical protein